jgi:glycosyltransferase involved in cell wall biosynthesis
MALKVTKTASDAARILIDASSVTNHPDGLSTYIIQLLRYLPAAAPDMRFTALLNPGVERHDLNEALAHGGMEVVYAATAAIGPRRDWHMLRHLRRMRGQFDLVHITAMTYPFALKGGICTVHDLTYRKWFHGRPVWRAAARFYLNMVIRNCVRNASAIIAVSAETKRDIADLVRITPDKLTKATVIHEGWEHMRDADVGATLPDTLPSSDYLFFLGTNRAHKNLTVLLKAFGKARDLLPPNKLLVITGSSAKLDAAQTELVEQINSAGRRVVFTGFVSDAVVGELYRKADAFLFPSLKEGFGLPILEAYYHGTPLIAARAPAIPEVAGDGALYFDPLDVDSITEAILQFYANPLLGAEMVERGRQRLKQFSWAKAAAETVAVYRTVLN